MCLPLNWFKQTLEESATIHKKATVWHNDVQMRAIESRFYLAELAEDLSLRFWHLYVTTGDTQLEFLHKHVTSNILRIYNGKRRKHKLNRYYIMQTKFGLNRNENHFIKSEYLFDNNKVNLP